MAGNYPKLNDKATQLRMTDTLKQRFVEDVFNHVGILHKICRVYKKDPADRDDLFQEILYNAWRSYSSFEGRSKFSTWLYRVALNTALHQNRLDKSRKLKTGLEMIENYSSEEPDEDNISLLYQAIEQLDPMEKSIVILYLDEQSYSEISEITGLTGNNVGVKLSRVKAKIRKILRSYGVR